MFAFTVSASVSSAERRRKAAVRQDPRAEDQYRWGDFAYNFVTL